jgi:hypothetical protein
MYHSSSSILLHVLLVRVELLSRHCGVLCNREQQLYLLYRLCRQEVVNNSDTQQQYYQHMVWCPSHSGFLTGGKLVLNGLDR